MKLPNQSRAIFKSHHAAGLRREVGLNCGIIDGLKCGGKLAALVIGPCDPLGFPEDLPLCIPAASAFVASCEDCIEGAAKTTVCAAVSAAGKIGIPIPSVLKSFCG